MYVCDSYAMWIVVETIHQCTLKNIVVLKKWNWFQRERILSKTGKDYESVKPWSNGQYHTAHVIIRI